ncbi:RNA polymerase sigma factor [Phytoactinopolyspora limicola]|uniref:RNA polymerase sigma factor n=1 Tax=Phytoactinopolyspora limicola TaxID=2715536 RepID=UPI00140D998A|nr:sigma-70 family RNA polymerase sigma factor [Phytoactinopolyspora limicola]
MNGVESEDSTALLKRIRAGDEAAFAALYRRVAPQAQRVACRIVRDPIVAEDIVHDAMYSMLKAISSGHGPSDSYVGYVMAAVRRLAYRYTRRNTHTIYVDDPAQLEPHLAPAHPNPQGDAAAAALAALPSRWRGVLWLTEVDRYTPAELAEQMSLNANAVSSLASRARQALRAEFQAQQG